MRVNNNSGKQSYIFEFERLLDDDIDNFASLEALAKNEPIQ